jgi:hypothetical protein
MMNWPLLILLTSLALFAYWVVYAMGGPLSEKPDDVDPKAILFGFPLWLATRRLKRAGMYAGILAAAIQELEMTSDPRTIRNLKTDKRRDIFIAGRDFFTWERSLLCPICLHWWATVLVGAVLLAIDGMNARADFWLACFYYLATHLLIRKIS